MMANRASASSAATCREHTSRRRSVPPSLPAPMSLSLNQRWRERPRCPASRVTPGRRDGSFTPSLVVLCVTCLRSVFARRKRGARLRVWWACFFPRTKPTTTRAHGHDAHSFSRIRAHTAAPQMCACTIACSMLAPCSASSMLFAALRPGRWPGRRALTTPARGTTRAITRWIAF